MQDRSFLYFLIGYLVLLLIVLPTLLLEQRRIRSRERYLASFYRPETVAAFKEARKRIATGWGKLPEQLLKEGRRWLWRWSFYLVLFIMATLALSTNISTHQSLATLFFSILCEAGTVGMLYFTAVNGLRVRCRARAWLAQANETQTIEGIYAGWWDANADKLLIRIKQEDGTNKILLMEPEEARKLPKAGAVVQVEYLPGSEAVIDVWPISGEPPEPDEIDDQQSKEG